MECENIYCVYQKNGNCTLEEISIDIGGRCQSTLFVEADEKILDELKEKLLNRFEKEEKERQLRCVL